jgi:hypothetical protein
MAAGLVSVVGCQRGFAYQPVRRGPQTVPQGVEPHIQEGLAPVPPITKARKGQEAMGLDEPTAPGDAVIWLAPGRISAVRAVVRTPPTGSPTLEGACAQCAKPVAVIGASSAGKGHNTIPAKRPES